MIDRSETNFFDGDPLRALSTLAYSDNVDLQRSAALAFAEITEKGSHDAFQTYDHANVTQPLFFIRCSSSWT